MSHFIYHDLGRIEYEKALERQTVAFNALLEAKAQGRTGENRLFFCEHQPVLTIGKSGKDTNLLIPKELLVQRGISSTISTGEGISRITVPDKSPDIRSSISIPGSWDSSNISTGWKKPLSAF